MIADLRRKDATAKEGEEWDDVTKPEHYHAGKLECIEIFEALGIAAPACQANVIKYVFRYKEKGGVKDLEKARWYLDRLLTYERENL